MPMLLVGCALPVGSLWPPPSDSAVRTIYVSLDTWHAMIAFPHSEEMVSDKKQQDNHLSPQYPSFQQRFEEWGYAEQAWYLEGRRGVTGAIRALLWPTEGVVEVGQYAQLWAERTPQPPADLFVFHVSEDGYRRLRHHLDATIMNRSPVDVLGTAMFYPAKRSYHFFHTCHQYAAYALKEAGLPLSPFWAFSRASFAWQLRRAIKIVEDRPLAAPPREIDELPQLEP